MIYNDVLVSGVCQSDSVTHIHVSVLFQNFSHLGYYRSSLVAQSLKTRPAMRETRVQSLGGEDPLEKEIATHSSVLAWRIPRTEEPCGLESMGSQRIGHN